MIQLLRDGALGSCLQSGCLVCTETQVQIDVTANRGDVTALCVNVHSLTLPVK